MTQKTLAERLGIASVTIEKFVNGNTVISEELAIRISKETGLDFEQLVLNSDPLHPRTINGTPLGATKSPRATARAQARQLRFVSRYIKEVVARSLQAMVEADEFYFQVELRYQLNKLIGEFGLRERTNELMHLPPDATLIFGITDWEKRRRVKSARKPKRRTA